MCNNNNNNSNTSTCECLRDILKVILILQKNACPGENRCLDTCDKKFLGFPCECDICNTRPISLYTCCPDGAAPLMMPISKDPTITTLSSVFRIEKLDGCCATFRVLEPALDDPDVDYLATDSFFTVNLNCVCVIRCLDDTYVDCV
jgi:hypothetical protein